jgi:ribose transport system substrate-binding protein
MSPISRRHLLAGVSLVSAGITAAWGEAPTLDRSHEAPRRKRIALVMKTLTNPFFAEMESGARRAEADLDIELLVKTAAQETSIEQQVVIVDSLIRSQVDAIVIAPGDSFRLIPVLKRARGAGIVVVNIDNRLDPAFALRQGLTTPFIGVDNRLGAAAAVRVLTVGITGPTEAVIIEGVRTAANAEARKQGALDAFGETAAIHVVAQESANWKIDEAHDVAARILGAHPSVALVYCANDMMALGAIRLLQEQNRADIRVGGFDALPEAMSALQAGRLAVTVDQRAAEQGRLGVQAAVALLKGEAVPTELMLDTVVLTAPKI